MYNDAIENPCAEILISLGDANLKGALLIGQIPFQFENVMGAKEYKLVLDTFEALCLAYEHWVSSEEINMTLRFNRDWINCQ